jgi:hypothetical protein
VCRNSAEVTSSGTEFERANSRVQVKVMTTSTMAPNTGHEPANDNGGVRSGRETAHTSSIQQELDCESLCALLGSVLAMVLVPVLLLQTLATYGDKPAQLMLELSCVLSVVFYLWSFFVTRVPPRSQNAAPCVLVRRRRGCGCGLRWRDDRRCCSDACDVHHVALGRRALWLVPRRVPPHLQVPGDWLAHPSGRLY